MSSDGSSLDDALLRAVPISVVDLEMTGLSATHDRICEVAVVCGDAGEVKREVHSLVRPTVPVSPGALACHGLTEDLLADAPPFSDVAETVADAIESRALIAHNVPFDLGFLEKEMGEAGRRFPPPMTLDTLVMARRLFAFRKNNLGSVARELGVSMDRAHRALDDARATFEVFNRMVEIVDPERSVSVRELKALIEDLAPHSELRLQQLKTLRLARRERRRIRLQYQSTHHPSEGAVQREVDVWFLKKPRIQGFCHLRQSERVFRLDRIVRVELLDATFEVPPDAKSRL